MTTNKSSIFQQIHNLVYHGKLPVELTPDEKLMLELIGSINKASEQADKSASRAYNLALTAVIISAISIFCSVATTVTIVRSNNTETILKQPIEVRIVSPLDFLSFNSFCIKSPEFDCCTDNRSNSTDHSESNCYSSE